MISVIQTRECPAALAVVLTPMVLQTVSQSQSSTALLYSSLCSITPCCTLTWDLCSLPLLETIRKSHSSFFFLLIYPGHQDISLGLCRAENKDGQRSHVLRKCFTLGYLFPWFNTEFTIHYTVKVLHLVLPFLY